MAIVTMTRTYNTSDQLSATYYNQDRTEIIAGVNSIVDAQISPTAAIQESKLAFSGSGHAHAGGASGKKIVATTIDPTGMTAGLFVRVNSGGTALETAALPTLTQMNRAFGFYVPTSPLVTGTDLSWNPTVPQAMTALKVWAYVNTPSSGQSINIEVRTSIGVLIAALSIPAGNFSANTTTIAQPALSAGDVLRCDITQVGSGTAGSKLSVTLEAIQT